MTGLKSACLRREAPHPVSPPSDLLGFQPSLVLESGKNVQQCEVEDSSNPLSTDYRIMTGFSQGTFAPSRWSVVECKGVRITLCSKRWAG
jgi:hypothetical protein